MKSRKSTIKIIYKHDIFFDKKTVDICVPCQREIIHGKLIIPVIDDFNYKFAIVPQDTNLYKNKDEKGYFSCMYLTKNKDTVSFKNKLPLKLLNIQDLNNLINLASVFQTTFDIQGYFGKGGLSATMELVYIYLLNNKTGINIFKLVEVEKKKYEEYEKKINDTNYDIAIEGMVLQMLRNISIIFYNYGIDGCILPNMKTKKGKGCILVYFFNSSMAKI